LPLSCHYTMYYYYNYSLSFAELIDFMYHEF
jgi:hypothetical protein